MTDRGETSTAAELLDQGPIGSAQEDRY